MMTKIFKQLGHKDINMAGGKGASLGEMTKAKIPVPTGFVILAGSFDRFLEKEDLNVAIDAELSKINYDDVNSVDRASNVIRDLIHDAFIPEKLQKEIKKEFKKLGAKYVAVRSSATVEDSSIASWAGELETYLDTVEENLFKNVKKCWSSLFTPRAIFYRKEKNLLQTKVSVAVVIQKMIESKISGVAFTVHPITKDKNQMIIEAGWGLGEAIVSGQITPDSYIIDKRDYSILDINVAEQKEMIVRKKEGGVETIKISKHKQKQQRLTKKQIIELSKLCVKIEKHYKKPQDIEWAFEKGRFYITQSRPITTL